MSDTILRYQVRIVDAPVYKYVSDEIPSYVYKSDAYIVARNWIASGYGVVIVPVVGEPDPLRGSVPFIGEHLFHMGRYRQVTNITRYSPNLIRVWLDFDYRTERGGYEGYLEITSPPVDNL